MHNLYRVIYGILRIGRFKNGQGTMVVTDTTVAGRTVRPPILVPDSFHPSFYVEAVHGVRVESLSTGPRKNVVVLWGCAGSREF